MRRVLDAFVDVTVCVTCDDGQAAVVSQVDVIWDEHARPSCCLHARMPQSLHMCDARVDKGAGQKLALRK